MLRNILGTLFIICALKTITVTQNQTLLMLQSAGSEYQTGQTYDINIQIQNVLDLWVADLDITYDPTMVYILGTKAGSPVQSGPFFTPTESTVVIRNQIQNDRLFYTLSLLNPAPAASGGGVVGTFRIYPLRPGKTQLWFQRAELTALTFTDQDGQRQPNAPTSVTFTPVLLELNISGDPVSPPDEATATPNPTETPLPTVIAGLPGAATTTPLVNVTLAPSPSAPTETAAPTADNSRLILLGGIVLMGVAVVGLVILFLRSRQRR